jgi:hypothetical protein
MAALLIVSATATFVGLCLAASRLGGAWGTAAALLGFAGYVFLFARALDQLPVDWNAWRARRFREYDEETEEPADRSEEDNGGKT